ncbi:MAG: MBL fold metallo-hydrolase [Neisseria sp.]
MSLKIQIMPVTPLQQNCSLIWDDETNEGVLTDVGGDVEHLLAAVDKLGVKLQAIWLTHGHVDHAGGVVELTKKQPLPVIGPHKDDQFWLDKLPQSTAQYGLPISPAFKPDRYLNEGEQLQVGAYTFDVLHIPGHTPGHVVFYCADVDLLVAGDVLFHESIGRTDFPRGNHADLIHNISTKLFVLPPETQVIPGHGRMTTIGHEVKHNPFF